MGVVCGRAWSAVVGVSTLVVVLLAIRSEGTAANYLTPGFHPLSVPLVVVDPYFRYFVYTDSSPAMSLCRTYCCIPSLACHHFLSSNSSTVHTNACTNNVCKTIVFTTFATVVDLFVRVQ